MKRFFTLLLVLTVTLTTFIISNVFAQEKETQKQKYYEEYGVVAEKGGILVGKGAFIVEPGFEYTHIDSQNLNITGFSVLPSLIIGLIQVQKIERNIWTPSVSLKYGIFDALEVDLKVPFSYRTSEYNIGSGVDSVEENINDVGLGDIEGTFRTQLAHQREFGWDILAAIRVKSDTGKDFSDIRTKTVQGQEVPDDELPMGSGFWAVEPSFTFVKAVDPAVIFISLGYFWHIERDISGIGDVDPGDSIKFSLGSAFALSDKIVLSTSFEQQFFTESDIENLGDVDDSDITVASLIFGGTYVLDTQKSVNISVSIGMTDDSPDVQVGVRVPIRF